ncbi:hypothetical protein ATANTOWER_013857 [Ataeniobius toweri]|uniref:Uncharacterized protein n=1 Tax=Ataeniobius toweri TaxID=208326 RepID=A0ABU7CGZ3_9TELE|nr:hypothetical protein [Ataeniobius toweri]
MKQKHLASKPDLLPCSLGKPPLPPGHLPLLHRAALRLASSSSASSSSERSCCGLACFRRDMLRCSPPPAGSSTS